MRNRRVETSAVYGAGRRFHKRASGCGNFDRLFASCGREKLPARRIGMLKQNPLGTLGAGVGLRGRSLFLRHCPQSPHPHLHATQCCRRAACQGHEPSGPKLKNPGCTHCKRGPGARPRGGRMPRQGLRSNLRCGAALRWRRLRATRARSCGALLLRGRRTRLKTTPGQAPHPAPPVPGAP